MDIVKENLDKVFSNKYTSTVLSMFLVLYGGLAAPKLPKKVLELLTKDIVKVIVLSLVVYSAQKDTRLSIMIGVVFLITMNAMSDKESFEGFESQDIEDLESFTNSDDYNEDYSEKFSDEDSNTCASKRCEHLLNVGMFIKHNLGTFVNLIKGKNPTVDLMKLFKKKKIKKTKEEIKEYIETLKSSINNTQDFHTPGPFKVLRNNLTDISKVLDNKNELHQKAAINKALLHMNCHIENLNNENINDFDTSEKIIGACGDSLKALE